VHLPRLSAFCTELTGIQQAWVDAAKPFPEVMADHAQWLGTFDARPGQGKKVLFVTCGQCDLSVSRAVGRGGG
jgi:inhibitor of KinA sporulation pathway (predicted exonuclease)